MKNLADFKRRIQKGVMLETYNHNLRAEWPARPVSIVQTNSFALATVKTTGDIANSWCDFPKASDFEIIDENTVLIYWGAGERREKILTYKFV